MTARRRRIVCLSAVFCVAAVIVFAVALEFSVVYAFEYPSCLFVRELRVWDLCVHCRKRASALTEYIRRNHVAIDALPQRTLPVSVRTYSIRGVERRCGGLGSDLMKFDLYIRHCPMEKAEFHALLALADGRRDAEFTEKLYARLRELYDGKQKTVRRKRSASNRGYWNGQFSIHSIHSALTFPGAVLP